MTEPAYVTLAARLRTVAAGLEPGERMPSETMVGILNPGTGAAVIRRAFALLVAEGALTADLAGGGHIVADPPGRILTPAADALLSQAAAVLQLALDGSAGPLPIAARRRAVTALAALRPDGHRG
jgi:DNA-binding GntR family transcriptional regulator